MTTQFPLSELVTVSVVAPNPGFAGFNTGNLAIFSDEAPGVGFPAGGIQYYQTPLQVATDFGTSSKTYLMANAAFSQNPNILLAGGQLIVVQMLTQIQTLTLDGIAASGQFKLHTSNGTTAFLNWNDTAATIQTALQAITGQSGWLVTGSIASQSLVVKCYGTYGVAPAITATNDSLQTGGSVAVNFTVTQTQVGETIAACLARTQVSTAYATVIPTETYETIGLTDFQAAATAFQATQVMLGIVGTADADNTNPSGPFYANTTSGNSQTRCISYFDTTNNNPLAYLAGYMSELMSANFTGNNTALTMNGKQIIGVPVDSVITVAEKNNAAAAGSDVYISIEGVAAVRSYGANLFADQVTGRLWLKGAIQTAYFNLLVQASTKIPQTETGMNMIRQTLKQVMQQGVSNGYIAAGKWQLPQTFGNITDFYNNLANYGFYVWTPPVSSQTLAQIQARTAPLAQIAYIEAGAVHTGSVLLYVQA